MYYIMPKQTKQKKKQAQAKRKKAGAKNAVRRAKPAPISQHNIDYATSRVFNTVPSLQTTAGNALRMNVGQLKDFRRKNRQLARNLDL